MSTAPRSNRNPTLAVFTAFCLLAFLASATAYADTSPWPSKKGELCWDANAAGEHSLVIAMVSNDGLAHYLFHGVTYRSDLATPPAMQPFGGNAEIDASSPNDIRIIGMLTKTEIHPAEGRNPRTLEIYIGHFNLDYETLNGFAMGVIQECQSPQIPSETPICNYFTSGVVVLSLVDCP